MVLERVLADIRIEGGADHTADLGRSGKPRRRSASRSWPKPVSGMWPKPRSWRLDVDFIDEGEVLTPAGETHDIDEWKFSVPFVCEASTPGEALQHVRAGVALIRPKGETGAANVAEVVRHLLAVTAKIRALRSIGEDELSRAAKDMGPPMSWWLVGRRESSTSGQCRRDRPSGRCRPC